MPGKIIQCLKKTKTENPLVLIDEVSVTMLPQRLRYIYVEGGIATCVKLVKLCHTRFTTKGFLNPKRFFTC